MIVLSTGLSIKEVEKLRVIKNKKPVPNKVYKKLLFRLK